jgi:glycosyltransferase involved in cell wall biosynthesis
VLKKRDQAMTYLMLKDIFPQNALDIEMLTKKGWRGLVTQHFFKIERELYTISDHIGCMSQANIDFLKKQNPEIREAKMELCPNTIDPIVKKSLNKAEVRSQYKIPGDSIVFLYGGNFGKPQGVDFIIKVLQAAEKYQGIHFVMSGSGTEFDKVKDYQAKTSKQHLTVFENLSRSDYYDLVDVCDLGMLFLDNRFTIPNFPSRLLDYLNHELPVIAATDIHTDVGKTICEGGFGWWCESRDVNEYCLLIEEIISHKQDLQAIGKKGKDYLIDNFHTSIAYDRITEKLKM